MNCSDISSADLDMRDKSGLERGPISFEEYDATLSPLAQADGDPGDETQ